MALGPHPQRELSLTPRLGFARPRLGVAAGAASFTGAGAPPPARAIDDTSPRICSSSARCGRRRCVFYWLWGPSPSASYRLHLASDLLVLGSVLPQALRLSLALGNPPPARAIGDTSPRI